MPADLPQSLRAARLRAGLTQVDLAATVGVSQKTISAWECGGQQPRTAEMWGRLAAALGVAVLIDAGQVRLVEPGTPTK